MKKREIVFFDVDGTLLDSETGKFPESALTAIHELQSNGHLCCISTGRCYNSLKGSGLCDYIDWDGYVLNNGQIVLLKNETNIYEEVLPKQGVEEVIERAKQHNHPLLFTEEKKWMINEVANVDVKAAHAFFNEEIPQVGFYQGQDIVSMIVYAPEGFDYRLYHEIVGIKVIPGLCHYADIISETASKYTGIKKLLEHFKIDDYIAFGDSMNDVEMLENARIGIVMGQASKEIKELATYVTSEVGKDGIANACKHFELI